MKYLRPNLHASRAKHTHENIIWFYLPLNYVVSVVWRKRMTNFPSCDFPHDFFLFSAKRFLYFFVQVFWYRTGVFLHQCLLWPIPMYNTRCVQYYYCNGRRAQYIPYRRTYLYNNSAAVIYWERLDEQTLTLCKDESVFFVSVTVGGQPSWRYYYINR